jgi:O-antigen/teichoic acid export membrane protein
MITTYISWTAKIITSIVQIYLVRILIEYLGLDGYAKYLIFTATLPWISLLDYGFGSSLQNKFSTTNNSIGDTSELRKLMLTIQCLLILINIPITILISYYIFRLTSISNSAPEVESFVSTLIILLIFSLNTSSSISYKVLYGLNRGYLSNIYPAASAIITLTALIIIHNFESNENGKLIYALLSLAIPSLVLSAISNLHILNTSSLKITLKHDPDNIKTISKNAFAFFIFSALVAASTNLDYFIMANTLQPSEIIEYSILSKVFAFTYFFIYTHFLTLWPTFSRIIPAGNFKKVHYHLKTSIVIGLLFTITATCIFITTKEYISSLISGEKISINTYGIIFFGLYYCIRLIYDIFSVIISSVSLHKHIIYYMPAQAAVGALLQYLLSIEFGILGIIAGLSISFLIIGIPCNIYIYNKHIKREEHNLVS